MTEPRIRVRRPDPPMEEVDPFRDCPLIKVRASPLTVMGVDASLSCTGIAILRSAQLKALGLSPQGPGRKLSGAPRLAWFRGEFTELLRRYRPDLIAIEGYGFNARNTQAHSLGELGGVLKLAALDAGVPMVIVPPTSLKLFATGKGNAEKNAVSKELFKRFDIDLMDNNEIDAAGLAVMGLAFKEPAMALTDFQKRALTKLTQ